MGTPQTWAGPGRQANHAQSDHQRERALIHDLTPE